MDASAPALVGQGLSKRFTPRKGEAAQALEGVDIVAAPSALTALVGPDGAGKTTLLRMAAGLLRADAGRLQVLGIDVAADPQGVQDRIGYMPERFGLYEDLSVQENLDLYADLHNVPHEARRVRYARLMAMTDLGAFTTRLAGQLSGGMKQKLGLACTLVRSPRLLLLDEPTVGVDPLSRRELWEILNQLVQEENIAVLVSTTYLDEAERCARVFVLDQGRLLTQGTPEAIRAHAQGLCWRVMPRAGQPARLLQTRLLDAPSLVIDAVPHGGEVRFVQRADADEAALAALLEGQYAKAVPAQLEDGFMVLLRARYASAPALPSTAAAAYASPRGNSAENSTRNSAKNSAGNTNDTVIEVRDLVRRFGDFTAVDHASFDVRRGEVFGLLGPNGAGKTTTFRMLCGLLAATSGELRVAGVDLRRARAQARRNIGYVSQKFALYGNLTVAENLAFFGGVYGLRGARLHQRMQAMLEQFDLQSARDIPSGRLPGGFKRRLAIAAALLHEPEILFLDEPTSGADPIARREFWHHITSLAEGGATIIVTTHFMEEAEYCDRIVIQDAGRMLALGTPWQVRAQAGDDSSIDMNEAFIRIIERERVHSRASTSAPMPGGPSFGAPA